MNSPLDEQFSIITVEYQEQHQAVDLSAVMDAPIYAVADGTVQKAVPDDDAYSEYVLLDHHNGFLTLYAVCNKRSSFKRGTKSQRVRKSPRLARPET